MHDFTPRESAGKDVAEPLKELEPLLSAAADCTGAPTALKSLYQSHLRRVLVLAYRRGALDALGRAVGASGSPANERP